MQQQPPGNDSSAHVPVPLLPPSDRGDASTPATHTTTTTTANPTASLTTGDTAAGVDTAGAPPSQLVLRQPQELQSHPLAASEATAESVAARSHRRDPPIKSGPLPPLPPPPPPPADHHADAAAAATATLQDSPTDSVLDEEMIHTRVEWQSMLESVLTGEVLKSEAKRLLGNNTFFENQDRNQQMWFALRSLRSGMSLHQEKLVVERERKRVDQILESVINFTAVHSANGPSPREQVLAALAKIDLVLSLYPTEKAVIRAHPLYASEALQTKLRTLYTWQNVTTQVHMQLDIFQRWIWVDDDSSSGPITTEQADADAAATTEPTPSDAPSPNHAADGAGSAADASPFPFLERILKESGMHKTMERRLMDELPRFLEKVRSNLSPVMLELQRLNLSIDFGKIQRLAEVPVTIVHEILRLRLSYAKRISEAPSTAMLEQLREDFRSVLVMAFRIRESYLGIVTPSPGWDVHPKLCNQEYSSLVTECVSFYFRLLRWKLSGISADQRIRYSFMNFDDSNSGLASSQASRNSDGQSDKSSSVKDTEILESEWEFFINLINIAGAPLQAEDRCIATGFCNLTLQLFEDIRALLVEGVGVSVPEADTAYFNFFKMSHKLLDVVKTKARNTKDFYRLIHTHFERSMEWSIDDRAIIDFLAQLQHTGHILLRPTDAQGKLVPSPFFLPSPRVGGGSSSTSKMSSSLRATPPAAMDASTPIMLASPALAGRKRLVELLLTRAMPWYDPSAVTSLNGGFAGTASGGAAAANKPFSAMSSSASSSNLLNHLYLGEGSQEADYGYVVLLSLPTHLLTGSPSGTAASGLSPLSGHAMRASPDLQQGRVSPLVHQAITAILCQWHGDVMDVNLGNDWGSPDLDVSSTTLSTSPRVPSLLQPGLSNLRNRQPPTALAEINVKPGTFRLVAPDAERLEAVKARFLTSIPSVVVSPTPCHIRNERSSHLRSVDMSMQGVGQISRQLLRVLLNGVQSLRERVATDRKQGFHVVDTLQPTPPAGGNASETTAPNTPSATMLHGARGRRGSVLSLSLATATVTSSPNTPTSLLSGNQDSPVTAAPHSGAGLLAHQSTPPATPESLVSAASSPSSTTVAALKLDAPPAKALPALHAGPTAANDTTSTAPAPHVQQQQQLPFTPVDPAFDNGFMGIDLMETYYSFVSDFGQRLLRLIHCPLVSKHVTRDLIAFAMDWISFTCSCHVKQDKKTFRWALLSLEFTMTITKGNAIFTLTNEEFLMLRARVGQAIQVLISHFEMDGPRSASWHSQQQQATALLSSSTHLGPRDDPTSPTSSLALPGSLQSTHEKGLSAIAVFMQRTAELAQRQVMSLQGLWTDDTRHSTATSQSHKAPAALTDEREHERAGSNDGPGSPTPAAAAAEEVDYTRALRELEDARTLMQQESRLIGRVLDNKSSELSLASLSNSSSNISIRWQHGKYIGGGTYGSVYLAINLDTGELLAVKEIRIQDTSNFAILKNMVKEEMKIMEQLSHPNIVQYYGIEVHRDKVYLFMEYVSNGALTGLLENGGIENEDVIRHYAHQIMLGLEYLHARKIVHRDIKPDNILVDQNGIIKLVDFGASKILSNQKTMVQQQAGGASLIGTPNYMAPEVILGSKDPSVVGCQDIWSLGCVLYELYTGKAPWSHLDNQWAIIYHCAMSAPPLPESTNISPAGQDFMRKCFTLSPRDRPTARQLLEHEFVGDIHAAHLAKSAVTPATPFVNATSSTSFGTISEVASIPSPPLSPSHFPTARSLSVCAVTPDVHDMPRSTLSLAPSVTVEAPRAGSSMSAPMSLSSPFATSAEAAFSAEGTKREDPPALAQHAQAIGVAAPASANDAHAPTLTIKEYSDMANVSEDNPFLDTAFGQDSSAPVDADQYLRTASGRRGSFSFFSGGRKPVDDQPDSDADSSSDSESESESESDPETSHYHDHSGSNRSQEQLSRSVPHARQWSNTSSGYSSEGDTAAHASSSHTQHTPARRHSLNILSTHSHGGGKHGKKKEEDDDHHDTTPSRQIPQTKRRFSSQHLSSPLPTIRRLLTAVMGIGSQESSQDHQHDRDHDDSSEDSGDDGEQYRGFRVEKP
ncbi:Suppressor of Sensor Kinase (SLN1), partial [Sorochytrium milnesiophthora]